MEESTIIEKLNYLEGTKESIKAAIQAKGQEIDDTTTFRQYALKITQIETGTDTTDADATAEDIIEGKTAYVQGRKVIGELHEVDGTSGIFSPSVVMRTLDSNNTVYMELRPSYRMCLKPENYIAGSINYDEVADIINLTPEKIIEGNTILGIEGTGKTSEDLQNELTAQTQKIEELETILKNKIEDLNKVKIAESEEALNEMEGKEGQLAIIYIEADIAFNGLYRHDGTSWIKISSSLSNEEYNDALSKTDTILG